MDKIKEVDEAKITRYILTKGAETLSDLAEVDVIVVGAGPSGLAAAKCLAEAGLKTVIFERRLSFGGGIGGGGMQLPKLIVQEPADKILRELRCRLEKVEEGVYVADVAEMIARLSVAAVDAGAQIILGVTVDDVIYRDQPKIQIVGAVVQWSSVIMAGLHVDPLAFKSKAIIDCTGHDAEVLAIVARKIPELNLCVPGEKALWASKAERVTVEKTGEVCPGLYVAGMAVAALNQTPRMGPIFGGMLLSGIKVAEIVKQKLKPRKK